MLGKGGTPRGATAKRDHITGGQERQDGEDGLVGEEGKQPKVTLPTWLVITKGRGVREVLGHRKDTVWVLSPVLSTLVLFLPWAGTGHPLAMPGGVVYMPGYVLEGGRAKSVEMVEYSRDDTKTKINIKKERKKERVRYYTWR
jgi:hypothetical protein